MKNFKLLRQENESKAQVEPEINLIFRLDRELNYIYVKSALPQQSLTFSECLKQAITELQLSEDTASLWKNYAEEVFQTGEELQLELEVSTPNGERYLQVNLVPELNSDASVEFVLGIVHDLTKNKQTEAALWQSEERFRAIFELAVGMALVDQKGILLQTNPTLQAMLDCSPEALQNQLISNFIHPR